MESSSCCIEEPCSDAEQRHPPPPPAEPLQRVGSGASVVLDPDTTTGSSIEAESRKLTSSQYKGVVAQPNGRWGAQIYEKHQRVWLGTFNEEADAARVYDVAAQRFRGRDAVTNFKPLSGSADSDVAELDFLSSHSKSEVVDMLRKHTYADELQRSKRTLAVNNNNNNNSKNSSNSTLIIGFHLKGSPQGSGREHLFDKTVTPSDVGKLNRLVIPKQHAEKHFPLQISGVTGGCKGVLLNFEDGSGKVWRFRYSYWNSSQSYVLTKGWSRFVKEKSLQAGDVVTFQRSKVGDDRREEKHLFIQCRPRARPVQVLRLFGVNIFKMPAAVENTDESDWNSNGKRSSRDLNYEHQFFKKQCVASL